MIWNVFYNKSSGKISWASSGDVNDVIKADQKNNEGLDYIQVDQDDVPDPELFYINSGTCTAKTEFSPSYSSDVWELDATITVSNLPAGTEVFLDGVSKGTMSDTSLTLTIKESGSYLLKFEKVDKITYTIRKVTKKSA